jgi:ribosomal protein S18 acetylase RimI-like enzyme
MRNRFAVFNFYQAFWKSGGLFIKNKIMALTVRIAGKEDAELIANISRNTFYETFAADNTKEDMDKFMNEQFTKEALMAEVGAEGNIFLLAFEADEALGYVRLREGEHLPALEARSSIELARIYVVGTAIGKGVGGALMKRSLQIAKEMGRQIIWLGVWEKNIRAIEFYKKWGFEKFSKHDFILGNDRQTDWLMKKELS